MDRQSILRESIPQDNVPQDNTPKSRAFLLMEGGPLYNIQRRVGLLKKNAAFTMKKAGLVVLLTWVPLFVLSAMSGTALGQSGPVAFLRDFSAYTRFLLAIPLLLAAELILGPMIAEAAEQFITSGVVGEKDYKQFETAVDSGLRSRDSVLAEIIILLLAYAIAIASYKITAVHVSTWYASRTGGSASLTWAGWWSLLVCAPLLQFLLLRWLWRLFLWFQFLGRICKLDVQLFPTHPDQAGGLGFVGETQRFFGILLFAYSIAITGVMANEIVYDKVPLTHFVPAIATYVVIALLIILGPLAVFTGRLLKTKRLGLHEYGTLATSYTGLFHKKWIWHEAQDREPLLGTSDIQSLADLGNSYAFIQHMNSLPVNPRTLIHLVFASLLPMTPLLLTVMSPKEVVKLLFKVFL
jgi:hypothetical protein